MKLSSLGPAMNVSWVLCRHLTYNIQWPRDSQKRLMPKFVTVEEAETVISGGLATPRAAPAPATVAPTPKATPTESPRVGRGLLDCSPAFIMPTAQCQC